MEKEEHVKTLRDLNDIQYNLFEHCIEQYEKRQMDQFWNDIESLDLLFGLSNKILQEHKNS
jgi:hypothetical protein